MHEANTPRELTARAASKLMSISHAAIGRGEPLSHQTPNGSRPATTSTGASAIRGAATYHILRTWFGIGSSLKRNFRPSATSCISPFFFRKLPTSGIAATSGIAVRLGPYRPWIYAHILRSATTLSPAKHITSIIAPSANNICRRTSQTVADASAAFRMEVF